MLNSRSIPGSRGRSLSLKTARRSKSPGDFYASVRCHGLVLTTSILSLFALRCDRNRNNPLGPQSGFVRERPATPTGPVATARVGAIRLEWQPVDVGDLGIRRFSSRAVDRDLPVRSWRGGYLAADYHWQDEFRRSLDASVGPFSTSGHRSTRRSPQRAFGLRGETVEDGAAPESL